MLHHERAPQAPEARSQAREQDEHGSAEVRDPAGQVEERRGVRGIERIGAESVHVDELPRVVEQHEDHHRSPEEIDGVEAWERGRRFLGCIQRFSTRRQNCASLSRVIRCPLARSRLISISFRPASRPAACKGFGRPRTTTPVCAEGMP